jgi:hypothetical protein
MRIKFLPKSKLGKWSASLIISLIILLFVFFLLVWSGQRGGETFFSNLYLTIPMICAGISGIAAFITGIIGIIKEKDYSVILIVSTIIGFLVLLFILAELIFPHDIS